MAGYLPSARSAYYIAKLVGAQYGNLADNQKDILLKVKNAIVATGQWYVSRSCDGLSVAAGDLWTGYGSIRQGAWVQLVNVQSGFQWVIHCPVVGGWIEAVLYISPAAGFSGGSTTTVPTASDSYRVNAFGVFLGTTSSPVTNPLFRAFVWVSADGVNTRVAWWYAGLLTAWWQVDTIYSAPTSFVPVMGAWWSGGNDFTAPSGRLNANRYRVNAEKYARTPQGTAEALDVAYEMATFNVPIVDSYGQNQATLQYLWENSPALMVGNVGPGRNGTIGYVADQWWGPSNGTPSYVPTFNDGDTLDNGRLIVVGQMFLPWDGTLSPPAGSAVASVDRPTSQFYGRVCGGGAGGGGASADGCGCGSDSCDADTATLLDLRNGAKELADKVGDASVTTATWNSWINEGIESLWKALATLFPDNFFKTVDFTLAGGTAGHVLDLTTIPDNDFRRIRFVELNPGSTSRKRIRRFNFDEKDKVAGAALTGIWCPERRYRVMGQTKLMIQPYERAGGSYRLYYLPKPAVLEDNCDEIGEALNPWAEYPKVFAARKALGKEESDTGPLSQRLAELRQEIADSAGDNDDGDAEVIADVEDDEDCRW